MSSAVQNLAATITRPAPADAETTNDGIDSMPWLPCRLTLDVPVIRFTIADLLSLKVGSIVETGCCHTGDLPLRVNKVLIGWTEFDVIGDRLAVRITEQS